MRTTTAALLASLCCTLSVHRQEPPQPQEKQEQGDGQEKPPAKKKGGNAVTRFFEDESERLNKEVQGSWMLIEYFDPEEILTEGSADGFMTFHDGFLQMILSIDTIEARLFRARERLLLRTGAYRYRFDEQGALQMSSVLSFTTQTDEGDPEREASGQAFEYIATLDDGVLQLHNSDGVRLSFRHVTAGDFPESAIRKLDRRRGGVDHWEDEDEGLEEPPK